VPVSHNLKVGLNWPPLIYFLNVGAWEALFDIAEFS